MGDPPQARLREIAALAEAAARRGLDIELDEVDDAIDDALEAMREVGDAIVSAPPGPALRGVS